MTYGQLITDAMRELEKLEYSDAALEAKELLGKALGVDCRSAEFEQLLWEEAEDAAEQEFYSLVQRRMKNEPLQYILGEWEFYGITLSVGPGVLIPRQDTELLVDIAIKLRGEAEQTELIDLCAGSGCIGFAIEQRLKNVSATLVENYTDPMSYMLTNKLSLGSRAALVKGDVLDENLPPQLPKADLIVCNPPYLTARDMDELQAEVRAEPVEALYGGEDGLDFYRAVVRLWKDNIKLGGYLAFEVGIGQAEEVAELMIQHGFKNVRRAKDAGGIERVVYGERYEKPVY
ncbi:MAG: peptide chain release factor N(5)-glutamine methyltransferase [Ruminococcus sp.]|nr:peptide chain release factor N(5)-glutamine methyltransferase [Ruminococcus sp.]